MMLLYSHVQRNLTLWLITSLQKVCLLLLRFTKQSSHLTMTAQPAVHVLDISQTLKLSDCTDILALCDTNLDGSIDSVNFSVSGYLPLIRKDSITHMHGLSVSFCMGLISRKLQILTYVSNQLYLNQCLTSFSSVGHLLRCFARFLILFHLTYMKFS